MLDHSLSQSGQAIYSLCHMGTHNPSTLAQLQHGYTNLAQISQENRVNESNGHLEVMATLGGTVNRIRDKPLRKFRVEGDQDLPVT